MRQELDDVAVYYERLGDQFADELQEGLDRVIQNPTAGRPTDAAHALTDWIDFRTGSFIGFKETK